MSKVITGCISSVVRSRFWSKVDKRGPSECWPWIGSSDGRRGYGQFYHNGRSRKATHIAIEIATGEPFPSGKAACHRCDNPPCVNPAHLFIGSMSDNIKDAFDKGRVRIEPMLANNSNRKKSQCKRGHPLAGDNLYITSHGSRSCKQCHKMHRKNYEIRQAAKDARTALGSDQ